MSTGGAVAAISTTEEEKREHHGAWHFVMSQQNIKNIFSLKLKRRSARADNHK